MSNRSLPSAGLNPEVHDATLGRIGSDEALVPGPVGQKLSLTKLGHVPPAIWAQLKFAASPPVTACSPQLAAARIGSR